MIGVLMKETEYSSHYVGERKKWTLLKEKKIRKWHMIRF